ncbi:hypothetical protein Tco_0053819 [Tanacetum coccineum]
MLTKIHSCSNTSQSASQATKAILVDAKPKRIEGARESQPENHTRLFLTYTTRSNQFHSYPEKSLKFNSTLRIRSDWFPHAQAELVYTMSEDVAMKWFKGMHALHRIFQRMLELGPEILKRNGTMLGDVTYVRLRVPVTLESSYKIRLINGKRFLGAATPCLLVPAKLECHVCFNSLLDKCYIYDDEEAWNSSLRKFHWMILEGSLRVNQRVS